MTPFGEYLEKLRRSRNLRQKQLASYLEIDPCYVSALEKGRRPPPSQNVLNNLIKNLHLSDAEQKMLTLSVEKSAFVIRMPSNLSKAEYELIHELRQQLGALSDKHVEALRTVLALNNSSEIEGAML